MRPIGYGGKDVVEEGGIALNDTPLGMLYLQPPTHTESVQRWELKKADCITSTW